MSQIIDTREGSERNVQMLADAQTPPATTAIVRVVAWQY